jgi:hypothetical protein
LAFAKKITDLGFNIQFSGKTGGSMLRAFNLIRIGKNRGFMMTDLKLVGASPSPYTRKVRARIMELGWE